MSAVPDVKMAQLRNFVAVVDHRGFKAAARAMCRSQPAISLSIKELEGLIGASLFERNSQSELTPFGKEFYVSARSLLDRYTATIRAAADRARLEAGAVRIAVVPSVARIVLPRALRSFREAHPKIEIWVEDGDADFVLERVLSRHVDFGCGGSTMDHQSLTFTKIVSDVMGVVCNLNHPLATFSEVRWDQLTDHNIISNGSMNLLERDLLEPLQRFSRMHISNITSLLALIEADVGVTVLPRFAFPENSSNSRFIPLRFPTAYRTIGTFRLKDVSLNPAAEAFHAVLIAELQALND